MKIKCKWVFLDKRELKSKVKFNIENMSGIDVMDMITTLLAQNETIRIIFEKDEDKK